MTHNVSLTNMRLSRNWSKIAMAMLVLLSVGVVIFYVKSLSPNSASDPITKSVYNPVKSFATAYTVNRTYTSKQSVIINNLWRPTTYIAGGDQHNCAISNGRVFCWGYNDTGRLGDGTSGTTRTSPVPVVTSGVLNGKSVTQDSAGYAHTCAIADGKAYCWGFNAAGSLGDGTTGTALSPVAVVTGGVLSGRSVTQLATGDYHTCAIADGLVFCWGYNNKGQVGDSSTTNRSSPVAVNTAGVLSGKFSTHIIAGDNRTCAVASTLAYCWGDNTNGELGNSSTTSSSIPVAVNTAGVLSGKVVESMASGDGHTCAIAEGMAYCWGSNFFGQLGNGNNTGSTVPVAVSTSGVLSGKIVTQIIAGYGHTCAIADGQAYCWGYNIGGQLGNNTTTNSNIPVAVSVSGVLSGKTVTSLTAGDAYSCAISNGRSYCWGKNDTGQLGVNTTTDSLVPIRVNDSYY